MHHRPSRGILRGHQPPPSVFAPGTLDVWAVGVTMVVGGQCFSWNAGLVAGTVGYGLGVVLMGAAYVCLALSAAEVSSALPFAGGVYGLARCTLGFYAGFLVGACEAIEYVLYLAVANVQVTRLAASQWAALTSYAPLVWALTHALTLLLLVRGGRAVWLVYRVLALTSLVGVFFFAMATMTYADLTQYGDDHLNVHGGAFVSALPQAAAFFSGIEALNTLANDVANPQHTIPMGQRTSMYTVLVTAVTIFLGVVSLPPGVDSLPTVFAVLNGGFAASFNISDHAASLVSVPLAAATMPGYAMAAANILTAMARSKLVPPILARRHTRFQTPHFALAATCSLSYGLCFCMALVGDAAIGNVCLFFGFASYVAQCIGFLYLRRHHQVLDRFYMSPLGVPGAVYASCLFGVASLSTLFWQADGYVSLVIVTTLVALLSVYYFGLAKHRQMLSKDERQLLLFLHVAKLAHVKPRHVAPRRWTRFWRLRPLSFHAVAPSMRRTSGKSTRVIRVKSISQPDNTIRRQLAWAPKIHPPVATTVGRPGVSTPSAPKSVAPRASTSGPSTSQASLAANTTQGLVPGTVGYDVDVPLSPTTAWQRPSPTSLRHLQFCAYVLNVAFRHLSATDMLVSLYPSLDACQPFVSPLLRWRSLLLARPRHMLVILSLVVLYCMDALTYANVATYIGGTWRGSNPDGVATSGFSSESKLSTRLQIRCTPHRGQFMYTLLATAASISISATSLPPGVPSVLAVTNGRTFQHPHQATLASIPCPANMLTAVQALPRASGRRHMTTQTSIATISLAFALPTSPYSTRECILTWPLCRTSCNVYLQRRVYTNSSGVPKVLFSIRVLRRRRQCFARRNTLCRPRLDLGHAWCPYTLLSTL
ncbi:Aste57867_18548 [Aphanomyces stellatus]|uniref:Aste57867_18548 protein n=1 Tax=Aphanomyces stellatus TaxID=120398 RepID=A0A485LB88_9STRA|nr:hypothetical protein As57867_018486 [Aphanomyces stellatus]VFT95284.1 Aste57867_18548 [Aphanomyces stellatus]